MGKRSGTSEAQKLVTAINTVYKNEIVGFASDPRFVVERVPSGSMTIDRITGGGFPRGRHVELYGDYMAGKSTLSYMTMALAQQRGEVCAVVDGEKVFDADYFSFLGGDPTKLIRPVKRVLTGEDLIEVLMLFASPNDVFENLSVVTIDSVASVLPGEELRKAPTEGDDRQAGRARMMSRLLRRVTTVNDKTLFLWTNQLIDKVSGYGGTTTPGGRALKFYASIRVEMRMEKKEKKARKTWVKGKQTDKDTIVGQWVVIRAEKNKTTRPHQEAMFYFDYDRQRIDREREIVHLGLTDGLIEMSGRTLTYEDSDDQTWSGPEHTFRKHLRENPELREELEWVIEQNTLTMFAEEEDGEPEPEGD